MPVREQRRFPASSLIIIPGYSSSESSASLSDLSPLVASTDPIVTIPANPTMDQNISDGALFSPDYSLYGPYRPMTPAEEVADAGDTNDPEFGDIVEPLFTDL